MIPLSVRVPLSEYSTGSLMDELRKRGWELSPRKRAVIERRGKVRGGTLCEDVQTRIMAPEEQLAEPYEGGAS